MGYSATDIITTLFRVTKNAESHEFVKLEFLRVGAAKQAVCHSHCLSLLMGLRLGRYNMI